MVRLLIYKRVYTHAYSLHFKFLQDLSIKIQFISTVSFLENTEKAA